MYAERGMLFDDENFKKPVVIDEKKIKKNRKKHGQKFAEGYYQAVKDMAENLEGVFYQYDEYNNTYSVNAHPSIVFPQLKEFRNEIRQTIRRVDASGIFDPDRQSDTPVKNPASPHQENKLQ